MISYQEIKVTLKNKKSGEVKTLIEKFDSPTELEYSEDFEVESIDVSYR